jgi:hypothetical protein
LAKRSQLGALFKKMTQQLGLLPAPSRGHTDNVWLFVFQAAIIPRFVEPLVDAIRVELKKSLPPDIESADIVSKFIQAVITHIDQGQKRLIDVLGSDVGISVMRLLLQAYQTDDFSQLPPHLGSYCAEVFQETTLGQRDSIKTPYIAFDSLTLNLSLVLSKQANRLVRVDTEWRVEAETLLRFSIDSENQIPVSELSGKTCKIKIGPLATRARDASFECTLQTAPTDETPIWFFDADSGKQRMFKPSDDDGIETCLLPAGRNYFIVSHQFVTTDLPDSEWQILKII